MIIKEIKGNKIAETELKRLKPLMKKLGIQNLDKGILLSYLLAYSLMMEAKSEIDSGGAVIESAYGPKENPWVKIFSQQSNNVVRFATQLGFSPTARKKLNIKEENKKPIF